MSDWKTRAQPVDGGWKERAIPAPAADTEVASLPPDGGLRSAISDNSPKMPPPPNVPESYHYPEVIPIQRVPKGSGQLNLGDKSYSLVVPGFLKDIYGTMIEGGEAARGHRTIQEMEQIAPSVAMLGIGAGAPGAIAAKEAPQVASAVAKTAAKNIAEAVPEVAAGELVPEAAVPAAPKPVIRTSKMLRDLAKQSYEDVDNSGVRISPESFQSFADQLPGQLEAFDADLPELTPKSAAVVKRFQNFATEEDAPKFSKLERLRQTLNKAASNTSDAHDALVLGDITDALDGYIDALPPEHLDVGEKVDLDAARASVAKARDLWRRNALMRRFEDIKDIAEHQDDPDMYIRQRARAITRKPNILGQYTPAQQDLITRIAKQGTLGTLGRAAPHLTPAGMVKGAIYSGAAASPIGPLGPAALAAASTAAYHGSQMLRRARLQQLLNNIAGPATPQELAVARARRMAQEPRDLLSPPSTSLLGGPEQP